MGVDDGDWDSAETRLSQGTGSANSVQMACSSLVFALVVGMAPTDGRRPVREVRHHPELVWP